MITPRDLHDASAILDAYPAGSEFVRLAELLSPASFIEPELLRAIRLECVPEAAVDVEQALWFSELIRTRGDQGIALTAPVRIALRERLRQRVSTDRDLVLKAKTTMELLHSGLSPLVAMEEQLAWSEALGDTAALRVAAQTLLDSLLSGRAGLDHWLGRAWEGLPYGVRDTPEGRGLAQVAALRGADIEVGDLKDLDIGRVWHLLPLVPLYLQRQGAWLRVGVPAAEATYGLQVPDTRPVILEVSWEARESSGAVRRSARCRGGDDLAVGEGAISVRTLAGARYELEPTAPPVAAPEAEGVVELEVLAAAQGQSILISFGEAGKEGRILIDCGPRPSYPQLRQRLEVLPAEQRRVDLMVLTHVDSDRVGGAIALLDDKSLGLVFDDIWFNGWRQLGKEELL